MTVQELAAQIAASNDAWSAADDRGKRVMLAHDVLALMELPNVTVETGIYYDFTDEGTLIDCLTANECFCCAKGASVIAAKLRTEPTHRLRYGNTFAMDDDLTHCGFSREQSAAIECAFEYSTAFGGDHDPELLARAESFGYRYATDEERLRAIMQNIIDNGEFVP